MSGSHICNPKERLICADCYNSLVEETCEQEAEITQIREQVAKLQAKIERVRAIVFKTYSALPGITIGEIRKALSESEES